MQDYSVVPEYFLCCLSVSNALPDLYNFILSVFLLIYINCGVCLLIDCLTSIFFECCILIVHIRSFIMNVIVTNESLWSLLHQLCAYIV